MRRANRNLAASLLLSGLLVLVACDSKVTESPPHRSARTVFLDDSEAASCKDVAWQAAASPEMQAMFKLERITSEPLALSERGIQLYVDQSDFSTVEVAIPSGGRFGEHSTFIGVTVARDTFEVVGMRESFWP